MEQHAPRPTHPGEILRENVLPALGLTQEELADKLGVSHLAVSELLCEERGVTPDMAIRLGKLLGNGARIWLHMQQRVDIALNGLRDPGCAHLFGKPRKCVATSDMRPHHHCDDGSHR